MRKMHSSLFIFLLIISSSSQAHGEEVLGYAMEWVAGLFVASIVAMFSVKGWKNKSIIILLSFFTGLGALYISPLKFPNPIMEQGWDLFIMAFIPIIIICLTSIFVIRKRQS